MNTKKSRKMRSLTVLAMALAMVLSLFGGISLLPTTAYAATNVEKANVICAQYPYMDACCDLNSQPTEIINISLSDAQAFGNAVSCPTTYWVIVYAKDGDNIKWTSNGKTGEQTSTPVSSKIGAYYNLWAGDVFSLNNSNVDPNKDVTFYISKGLKSYSVTVAEDITNGTVTADKASAAENDTVTLTVTPAENYEIDSVSYNDGSDHVITPVESVYSFSMPASNVTVTATFKAATPAAYTVTYDANGATSGTVPTDSTSYDANASVTVLGNTGNLVKTDYTFAGWNTAADGTGTDYAADATFTITADTTLYAKWTANTITVTFSTSTDGKTINKDGVTCNRSFDSSNNLFMGGTFSTTLGNFTSIVVTAQDANRVGMDSNYNLIAGWSGNTWTGNASSVNFGRIMGNGGNVTIVFTITTVTTYTVTFNSKVGSDVTSASVAEGNKVTKPTNPTRDGYTFLGWSKKETGSTYYDFDTTVTSSFTLYAQWEKKVETGVSDSSDISVEVEGLNDAIDTSDLNANQYVTSKIEVNNEAVADVSDTVSNKVSEVKGTDSSITVNYLTIDISKIITTVNSNGSTTDGTKTAITELTKPIEVAIPNIDGDKVDIVREHSGVATQFTERSSRNTVQASFVDGEYYYDKANKIVYIYSSKFSTYAILTKPASSGGGDETPVVTTYTITYDLDGGTVATENPTSYTADTETFTLNNPTKDGYTFKGWTGTGLTEATTKVTINKGSTGDRTYTATWQSNDDGETPVIIPDDADSEIATANPTLFLRGTVKEKVKKQKATVTLKWNKVKGVSKYEIYSSVCGDGKKPQVIATVSNKKKSYKDNSITWGNHYKYYVKAIKQDGTVIKESLVIHLVVGSNTECNAKRIKAKNMKLKVGTTANINATLVPASKNKAVLAKGHMKADMRYYSDKPSVATVGSDGTITAIAKGKAKVYIFAPNGVRKAITVRVK